MAGQLPNVGRFAANAGQAIKNAPAQMAQTIKQNAVNEVKAMAQDAVEQVGADEFLPEAQEPEPLRQGQMANPEEYSAQVKQVEAAQINQLRMMLQQEIAKAGQARMQNEQMYQQNVNQEMQTATQQQQTLVESAMPTPNRPSAKKSAEISKKKN